MENERKTVAVKIVSGYWPEMAPKSRKGYFQAIFTAFWGLAK